MDSDLDPDPDIFVIDLQDANKKLIYKKVFLLFTFSQNIYTIFKRLKYKRSHKSVGIKVFLLFFLDDRRIRIHTSDQWIRIREAQTHVDPDPGTLPFYDVCGQRYYFFFLTQFCPKFLQFLHALLIIENGSLKHLYFTFQYRNNNIHIAVDSFRSASMETRSIYDETKFNYI